MPTKKERFEVFKRDGSRHFIDGSLKTFLRQLPLQTVLDSMNIAIGRMGSDRDRVINYFCGVCWNRIKALTDPQYNIRRELFLYWKNQPRGSGYLNEKMLKRWLDKYTVEQIKECMDKAQGIWRELHPLFGGA